MQTGQEGGAISDLHRPPGFFSVAVKTWRPLLFREAFVRYKLEVLCDADGRPIQVTGIAYEIDGGYRSIRVKSVEGLGLALSDAIDLALDLALDSESQRRTLFASDDLL